MGLEHRRAPTSKSEPPREASLGRVQVHEPRLDQSDDLPQASGLIEDARSRRPPGEPVDVPCAQLHYLLVQPPVARAGDGDLPATGDLIGYEVGDAPGDAGFHGLCDVKNG